MQGLRKARTICRVAMSLPGTGRVFECRCAAAIPYNPRQVHSTAQSRSEVNYQLVTLEFSFERTAPGHLWPTYRPSMLNAASKKLARHPIQGHGRDVTGPA